ncbi:MAG: cytochrome c-type biosis protein CcmE [Acidimicrobiales bacterium]|nr:cytochrome c-type biosis protein CcmE [Acidimicrobiales bacterium]
MDVSQGGPVLDGPDDRDLEDGGLDLTPRTDRPTAAGGRRRWGSIAMLVLLVLAGGFIAKQALGSATLFYKNADEAVAQKAALGQKRFRLQGVVNSTPRELTNAVEFTVAYNGVPVNVRHTGSEPALFKPGLPVVAEGHWNAAGNQFESDRLLVKHTANYKKANDPTYGKKHPDRVQSNQKDAGGATK